MGKLEDKKVFIDNIVDSTLSGDLKWVTEKNLFNTYKRQKYKLILDKDLYINFDVNLNSNEQAFYLYEKDVMVDSFHFNAYSNPRYANLKNISDFLRNDFLTNVKRDIPSSEKDNFYNDLSKNFTKKSFRKNKLENILSESPTSNVSSKLETKVNSTSDLLTKVKSEVKSETYDDSSKKLESESLWLLCIPILGMLHYFVTSDSVDNKYLPVIYSYFLLQIAFIISILR